MNVGGHIAVARELHPSSPAIWLGAALPDLATMGRHRLLGSTDHDQLAVGIELHHRTDDVFHRHPHFTATMARLRVVLDGDGVNRGAARAVGHVGPELLIDGHLLESIEHRSDVEATLEQIDDLDDAAFESLVATEHRLPWLEHLRKVRSWGLPGDYHDPHAVAARLHRILDRRPRLAFEQSQIEPIGHRLAEEQPGIVGSIDELMADLVAELSR